MTFASLIWDNPILIKHVRSRLRRQDLIPSIIMVAVFSVFIVWLAIATDSIKTNYGFIWMLVLQGFLLFILGTMQVSSAVTNAKDCGILDFHRISPQPPLAIALGFLLGAPIREYVMFACTLPFSLYFIAKGAPQPYEALAILIIMFSSALLYHSAATLASVTAEKARAGGVLVIILIIILYLFGFGPNTMGVLTISPTCQELLFKASDQYTFGTFFGVTFPAFLVSLIHQIPLFLFFSTAVVRKMRHERMPLYSKPEAVAFYLFIAFLVLGDIWDNLNRIGLQNYNVLAVIYSVVPAACLLTVTITPNALNFANGIRRAHKLGKRHQPLWSDLSTNWAPIIMFTGISILAGILGLMSIPKGRYFLSEPGYFQKIIPIIIGACVILYFGNAKQYFDLRFKKNSNQYFLLFLFLLWVVPLLVGVPVGMSNNMEEFQKIVFSLSPVFGIGLSGDILESGKNSASGFVALISSLMFAIAFIILRINVEKEAEKDALKPPA